MLLRFNAILVRFNALAREPPATVYDLTVVICRTVFVVNREYSRGVRNTTTDYEHRRTTTDTPTVPLRMSTTPLRLCYGLNHALKPPRFATNV